MELNPTRNAIRQAIEQVLREHVENPFMLLREIGLQARLWRLLSDVLQPDVVDSQVTTNNERHKHCDRYKTARVQLELKVGGRERSDIVVLRADKLSKLTCWTRGPTDVVAAIEPGDVEAVIEIKAGPSRDPQNRRAFVADVRKLDRLRAEHPRIQCYFVLVDKSLSVPGAVCDPRQPAIGTWFCELGRELQTSIAEATGSFVEIWDLDCGQGWVPTPRLRYWV